MPQIKEEVTRAVEVAQKAMEKMDMKSVSGKIQKAVQVVKNKIDNLKKSTENNEIKMKINNKEAEKQISQLEKEIDSLQKKVNARQMKLDIINPQMDKIVNDTRNEVVPEGISKNDKSMDAVVNNVLSSNKDFTTLDTQAQKLYTEIEMYNKQLNETKSKMSQLKQEVNQASASQEKMTSFFNEFKSKIDQAKTSVSGMKTHFNQIPKITQNITNNVKKMSIGVKQGLGHVLKYVGALLSIRGIYGLLRGTANAWLSSQNAQAQQLSANIAYMKYAMGSALAPVIQFVTNLVYQLMKAIQSVAYALTGVNIFAKASAKSYASMAGNAKKAKKETQVLAGVHNEINNIQSNKESDSGSGSTAPSFDLSQMDNQMLNWVSNIKDKLFTLFEPIQKSWNKYGQPLLDSMKYAFNSNIELIKSMGKSFEEVWLNGTGERTVSIILQILTSIFNICGNINTAFKSAWENSGGTEIIQNIWNGLNNILEVAKGIFQTFEGWTASESFQEFANSIIEICVTLSGWLELITQKLGEIWENGGKQTFTSLLEFISKLITAISSILQFLSPVIEFVLNIVTPVISGIIEAIGYVIDALSGVLDFIIGVFTGDWERAWEGIKEFFVGIWNALSTVVSTVLNAIWSVISTVFNTIKTFIVNVWNGIVNTISNVWKTIVNKVKEGVSGAWNAITSVFSKISGWFKEQFTKAWQAVKNVFSTGGKIFDGIKDGIVTTFKSVVNAIINGINKVISIPFNAINGVLNGIRNINILGVQPFTWVGTISVPQIPQLAKGNVAYGPLVAMFGEYSGASNNPEITTPQNIMRETFEDVLASQEWNNNSDKPIRVQIYWGTKAVVDEIIDGINQKTRQTGKAQIKAAYDY